MKNRIHLRGIGLTTTGAMRLDASKIEAEPGWTPQVNVQEGLRRTVEWTLTHQGWCSPNQRWCAAPCEFRS